MTLATRPKLLLLDEPMAGMSLAESERMVELLAGVEGTLRHPAGRARHGRRVRAGRPHLGARVRSRDRLRRPGVHPRQRRSARGVSGRPGSRGLTPLLDVADLTARYGTSQVLFGMTFEAERGECITLIGRNGMGKSTTVKQHAWHAAHPRGQRGVRRPGDRRMAFVPYRAGRHRARAGDAADLSDAHGAREPGRDGTNARRTHERVDAGSRVRTLSAAARARAQPRQRSSPAASSRCSRSAARS